MADAIKMNSTLQRIDVCDNMFEGNLVSQYECDEYLKENISRKKRNCRKLLCAFTRDQVNLVRLRFDKMILRFVYYPIMGVVHHEES